MQHVGSHVAFALVTGRNEVVAKVIFLKVSVCPQGRRVSASVHAWMPYPPGWRNHPPRWRTPQMEDPPDGDPPPRWRNPPNGETPPDGGPPGWRPSPRMEKPPQWRNPPPREADSSIRSTSGRYASYWNAYLYKYTFTGPLHCISPALKSHIFILLLATFTCSLKVDRRVHFQVGCPEPPFCQ